MNSARRAEAFFKSNPERRPVVNGKPLHWDSILGWILKGDDRIDIEDGRRQGKIDSFSGNSAMNLVIEKLLDALWEKTQ